MLSPISTSSTRHPTFDTYFAANGIQVLATSEPLGWNSMHLRTVWVDAFLEFKPVPILEQDVLVLKLEGFAHQQMRVAGGKVLNNRIAPGTMLLFPRQHACDIRFDSAHGYAILQLDRLALNETLAADLHGDPYQIDLSPTYCFNDPLLYQLVIALCNEMRTASPLGFLFAESVGNTILFHLLKKYSNIRAGDEMNRGRFTSGQLAILNEYIYEHLDQKISLIDLASCLHVSVPHFERKFRATMHCAPYQYVLECRLEQARQLLGDSRISIYDVARRCGFANQSHFTRHFTRYAGVPPARYANGIRM